MHACRATSLKRDGRDHSPVDEAAAFVSSALARDKQPAAPPACFHCMIAILYRFRRVTSVFLRYSGHCGSIIYGTSGAFVLSLLSCINCVRALTTFVNARSSECDRTLPTKGCTNHGLKGAWHRAVNRKNTLVTRRKRYKMAIMQ